MKDLTESLAGRIGILTLLPFSILEKRKIPDMEAKTTYDYFIHSALYGSFPEMCVYSEIEPAKLVFWLSGNILRERSA
jgi:predicted AAA+ superfamily ATPase